jgi:hypothetical protein
LKYIFSASGLQVRPLSIVELSQKLITKRQLKP